MDVPVQHQLRMVAVQQDRKRCEAAVRQVGHVAVAVQRRVGDQYVNAAMAVDLAAQMVDALFHLGLGKLPGAGAVAAAAAQPGDAQAVVYVHVVIQADDALRRAGVVALVMVAVYVQKRHGRHGGKVFQIMAAQIAAGNDEFDALDLVRGEVVPEGLALLIRNGQDLHSSASFSTGRRSR